MLNTRKTVLALAIGVSMCGVVHADLLGLGGNAAAGGGIVSGIDAFGPLGSDAGIGARGHGALGAATDVWATSDRVESETIGRAYGTVQGSVATSQQVGGRARAGAGAAMSRADRVAQRSTTHAAVVAEGAYQSSTAVAGNAYGTAAGVATSDVEGAAGYASEANAGVAASTVGTADGYVSGPNAGVATSNSARADAYGDTSNGFDANVEGEFESNVAASASSN